MTTDWKYFSDALIATCTQDDIHADIRVSIKGDSYKSVGYLLTVTFDNRKISFTYDKLDDAIQAFPKLVSAINNYRGNLPAFINGDFSLDWKLSLSQNIAYHYPFVMLAEETRAVIYWNLPRSFDKCSTGIIELDSQQTLEGNKEVCRRGFIELMKKCHAKES